MRTAYNSWRNRPMPVILRLTNQPKTLPPINDPSSVQFRQGHSEIITSDIMITRAFRDDTIEMSFLDWNTILAWVPPNSSCVTNPATSTRLPGLPACFNNITYAQEVFSASKFPYVTNVCYGQTATLPSGTTYPCNTNPGANTKHPVEYNHNYGCYHCIADSFPLGFKETSSDAFAARPSYFELDSSHRSYPDLLRSGLEYNLSISAYDGAVSPATTRTNFRIYSK